ncbi:siderophore-iron reductase FhuF [[Erwinia] mediterraneensis]|uniref:siderophore-iron reductase FhuF n=1 Tax=[Erwinia] mediterraneensis TaxID=2161819 RepID=UPI001031727B|nr:siderophore-iron reductase FhuF [[Erwinia] mediterraneensis]
MSTLTPQAHRFSRYPLIFMQSDRSLAAALHDLMSEKFSWMLDAVRLGQQAPENAMTLDAWSQPAVFRLLEQRYGDDLYRNHPTMPREAKPLQSLWAQWYFGLILPPMMLALLQEPRALNCSPQHIHVEFHETGRPATFWIDVQEDEVARYLSATQRIDRLIQQHLIPVVDAIARHGDINSKLIWNNLGYGFWWFLGELKSVLDDATLLQLEQALFFSSRLLDGSDNPLYRTMIPRNGIMERRSCCQRYRIPDVARCGNCTLKAV